MADKFSAVWVSHTSISTFLKCPRGYYLKHVYKDPNTNHKIKLMSAPLALGQAVHDTLESLSVLPTAERFRQPLMEKFEASWEKVSGKKGGFFDMKTELKYQNRGRAMIRRVSENPGPLEKLAVKINQDLPWYWLSEEDNIILCGKVDWLEYLPESDSVHIIDFKTGKQREDDQSLQLPIYHLLVKNCQNREVSKASYWYLESNDDLTPKELPSLEEAKQKVLEVALKMKTARQLEIYSCPSDGCFDCSPYEAILNGEGELIGTDEFNMDVYVLNKDRSDDSEDREGTLL